MVLVYSWRSLQVIVHLQLYVWFLFRAIWFIMYYESKSNTLYYPRILMGPLYFLSHLVFFSWTKRKRFFFLNSQLSIFILSINLFPLKKAETEHKYGSNIITTRIYFISLISFLMYVSFGLELAKSTIKMTL